MSCPWALVGSRIFIILAISGPVTGIGESVLYLFILSGAGTSIELLIRVHCLAKQMSNSSAFRRKFKMDLLL